MNHREGRLKSRDGLELYYQCWEPSQQNQSERKPVIAIVHGGGEHSGRYANVVGYFGERNYPLYGFDFRGHGKSGGRTGHVSNWQEYREDLECFLQLVRDENPERPVFLYCHSMGAQIALDYLTINGHFAPVGVIASSPALAPPPASRLLILAGRILSAVMPGFPLDNGLDVNAISRDQEEVRAYSSDPLVSSRITARFGSQFLACIDRVQSNAANFDIPLLMFHGDADRIIPVQGTLQFFEKINSSDKQLKIYPGGFHESHNDLDKLEVFRNIELWLNERTKSSEQAEQ